jgi:hypothetical protein
MESLNTKDAVIWYNTLLVAWITIMLVAGWLSLFLQNQAIKRNQAASDNKTDTLRGRIDALIAHISKMVGL